MSVRSNVHLPLFMTVPSINMRQLQKRSTHLGLFRNNFESSSSSPHLVSLHKPWFNGCLDSPLLHSKSHPADERGYHFIVTLSMCHIVTLLNSNHCHCHWGLHQCHHAARPVHGTSAGSATQGNATRPRPRTRSQAHGEPRMTTILTLAHTVESCAMGTLVIKHTFVWHSHIVRVRLTWIAELIS